MKYQRKVQDAVNSYNAKGAKIEELDLTKLQDAKSVADQKKNDIKDAIRIRTDIETKRGALDKSRKDKERLDTRNLEIEKEPCK